MTNSVTLFSIIIPTMNEEENIESLIRSISEQDYRPIEILVVDGGSRDRTREIVRSLMVKLNTDDFIVRLLDETDSGNPPCPANARNFGIKNANGRFILEVGGDFLFTDSSFLEELKKSLKRSPIVRYRLKTLVDNWLEFNIDLDYGSSKPTAFAFRREVFEETTFDPTLGAGEDHDFNERLRETGFLNEEIPFVDVEIGRHDIHTLKEFLIQKLWHGRTCWLYIKKHPHAITGYLLPAGPSVLLFLALISGLLAYPWIAGTLLAVWTVGVLYLFVSSPSKSLNRLVYIVLNCSLGSLVRVVGLINGLFEYIMSGSIKPGRSPYWKG